MFGKYANIADSKFTNDLAALLARVRAEATKAETERVWSIIKKMSDEDLDGMSETLTNKCAAAIREGKL